MAHEHFDVIIIGAGVSGIGLGCHLRASCPRKRFAILERRADLGGTWDLFKYPGIRSDSDMLTFGYSFRPWKQTTMLADGPAIKEYMRDTARENDVYERIRFNTSVADADWSSADAHWTLTTRDEKTGEETRLTCDFLIAGTGYYRYEQGHQPAFPGEDRFAGALIHPQQWPQGLDYAGKRVVIIGSGATAVTMVPAMAPDANVTMLQRSPSYILSLPAEDKITGWLGRKLPEDWVYGLARKRNILTQRVIYNAAQRWPRAVRWLLHKAARASLGKDFDMRHFQPSYNPWDERLCVVPSGDLFRVLKKGQAEIVTDTIETFTEKGIRLTSGRELEADIIVAATGLQVQLLGGMKLHVNGEAVDVAERMMYRSVMLEGVPNFVTVFGYINASWTLKVDITGAYVCRLLEHMDAQGFAEALPVDEQNSRAPGSMLDALKSGYAQRAAPGLPRQGLRAPWRVTQDYKADTPLLCNEPIDDGVLQFAAARRGEGVPAAKAA